MDLTALSEGRLRVLTACSFWERATAGPFGFLPRTSDRLLFNAYAVGASQKTSEAADKILMHFNIESATG